MIGCWQWCDIRPVTAELGGGVESDRFGLKDFLVQDVSVCRVADVVREGRDLESYGGGC